MKYFLAFIFASCACARMIPRFVPNGRIVGGHNASTGQFPYQVSLTLFTFHHCGGSILNERTILTTANCLNGLEAWVVSSITVYVGSIHLDRGGVDHRVSDFLLHEDYNAELITNDIALIYVQNLIEFTANARSIEVDSSFIEGGTLCVMSGWGALSYPEVQDTDDLKYIDGIIFPLGLCSRVLQESQYPVRDTNICAFSQRGKGVCRRDFGGPLVANGKQVGISSWVSGCATGVPDVYTRLSSYNDWINNHTLS